MCFLFNKIIGEKFFLLIRRCSKKLRRLLVDVLNYGFVL